MQLHHCKRLDKVSPESFSWHYFAWRLFWWLLSFYWPPLDIEFCSPAPGSLTAGYLLAEVSLMEPLRLSVDGSQRGTLEPCLSQIPLLNGAESRSLNHALTLLSQRFEPSRRSHNVNAFRQGFTQLPGGRWVSLDEIRLAKISEFLNRKLPPPGGSTG